MNYDHAFHAGNFADVLKHAALCLALSHLVQKAAPLMVLDTHAGQGRYDLAGPQATRTGEAEGGVLRLLAAVARAPRAVPAGLAPYLSALDALCDLKEGAGLLRAYPGSPLFVRHALRPGDRLLAVERHPVHARALAALLRGAPGCRVLAQEDGYAALKALVPPPERRGLVLIDPPFERPDEFAALSRALRQGLRRWPAGPVLVWLPLKDPAAAQTLVDDLAGWLTRPALLAELWVRPFVPQAPLAGTAVLAINPPFALRRELPTLLPWLAEVLADPLPASPHRAGGGLSRLTWVVAEEPG